ncbi:MAG: hypothetical protein ABIY55_07820, partial [Kofleriaceae bacterium]
VARQPIGLVVSREDALARLQAQAMTPHEEKWITPWLVERRSDAATLERQMTALFEAILDHAPAVAVRWGFEHVQSASFGSCLLATTEQR